MSKSGLYAHFGSKQELQLATVEEAGRILAEEVVRPATGMAPHSDLYRGRHRALTWWAILGSNQ